MYDGGYENNDGVANMLLALERLVIGLASDIQHNDASPTELHAGENKSITSALERLVSGIV